MEVAERQGRPGRNLSLLQAVPNPRNEDAFWTDFVANHVVRAAERHNQFPDSVVNDAPSFGEIGQAHTMRLQRHDQSKGGVSVLLEQPSVKAINIEFRLGSELD